MSPDTVQQTLTTITAIALVAAGFHGLRAARRALQHVPTGGHSIPTIFYRTKDGREDYGFSFEPLGGGSWRAYIVSQPPYNGRKTGLNETHRLRSGGRYYVCWTERLLSEAEARRVAALWADKTQEYIRTGQRF